MDFRAAVRRFGPGLLIAAVCVLAVGLARHRHAASMSDAGLQARSKGDAQAPLLLTEYSDFQCPNCRLARPEVEELLRRYQGRVRFVFRHFPLTIHRWSREAALAAECAARQGRFWPFHDLLFEKQQEWSEASQAPALFVRYAKEEGLDLPAFEACVASPEAAQAVKRDMAEASAWEVDSTPTLFIGRKRLVGARQIHLFAPSMIEKELRKAGVGR